MVGKKELCLAHNEISLAVEDHHISYYPEVKIRICSSCHVIVHHPPEAPEDFESLPKKLQELIRANIARKTEREKELGISFDYDDIDFEMKQEKLGLMKYINKHWELKNLKLFCEMFYPQEPLSAPLEPLMMMETSQDTALSMGYLKMKKTFETVEGSGNSQGYDANLKKEGKEK